MDLATLVQLTLKTSIALTVLSLALRATFSELAELFRRPRSLARALFAMDVVMPAFAVGLALAFDLHPAVKIALVALSVSPVPPLLPKKALEAGGKRAYTIGLLVTAALLAIIVVPLALELFERIFDVPLEIAPTSVASIVFMTVLAPLVAGMAIQRLAPALAERLAGPLSRVAAILLLAGALPILALSWHGIVSLVGNGTLAAIVVFALVGLFTGHTLGGRDEEDRRVLALSTASRHPGVAFAIAHSNFPEEKLAMAAVVLYLVVSALIFIPYLNWTKHEHGGIDRGAPRPAEPTRRAG
jgi:BASS family bile acid:Na+ symporter